MRKRSAPAVHIVLIKVLIGLVLILLIAGLLCSFWLFRLLDTAGVNAGTIFSIITQKETDVLHTEGRTNVMVLGIAGGDHDGPALTDTIMVLSLDWKSHSVAVFSLPRDIWLDSLKDKINTAYYYGELYQNDGFSLAKKSVTEVLGIPLHYVVLLDFAGFRNVIDMIGGIDVFVQNAFTDEFFPLPGKENDLCKGDPSLRCRYEVVSFEQGLQHMDGERALKYVRSRKADGDEGTDFARGRRQQEVILALKEKLMKPSTWFPPSKTEQLIVTMSESVKTDLLHEEALVLAKSFITNKAPTIKRIHLEEQLIHPPDSLYGGRYVLIPAQGFTELHTYIRANLQ